MLGAVVYGFRAMRWEWLILLSAVIALDPSPYWGLAIPYLVFVGHEAVQGVGAGWMYYVATKNAQREAEPAQEGAEAK
jgi:hypothetical protein